MKSIIKFILIIFILFLPVFHSSPVGGEDLVPDLKGKWNGKAFLYADPKGFSSAINKTISIDVIKQAGLDFSGNIELKEKGNVRKFGFSGFMNKQRRYICIIIQEGDINIGYLITKNIMKIHLKSFGRNEITVYRLIKEKKPFLYRENLSKK